MACQTRMLKMDKNALDEKEKAVSLHICYELCNSPSRKLDDGWLLLFLVVLQVPNFVLVFFEQFERFPPWVDPFWTPQGSVCPVQSVFISFSFFCKIFWPLETLISSVIHLLKCSQRIAPKGGCVMFCELGCDQNELFGKGLKANSFTGGESVLKG